MADDQFSDSHRKLNDLQMVKDDDGGFVKLSSSSSSSLLPSPSKETLIMTSAEDLRELNETAGQEIHQSLFGEAYLERILAQSWLLILFSAPLIIVLLIWLLMLLHRRREQTRHLLVSSAADDLMQHNQFRTHQSNSKKPHHHLEISHKATSKQAITNPTKPKFRNGSQISVSKLSSRLNDHHRHHFLLESTSNSSSATTSTSSTTDRSPDQVETSATNCKTTELTGEQAEKSQIGLMRATCNGSMFSLLEAVCSLTDHMHLYLITLTYQEIVGCLVAFTIAILNIVRMRNLFCCNLIIFVLITSKLLNLLTMSAFSMTKLIKLLRLRLLIGNLNSSLALAGGKAIQQVKRRQEVGLKSGADVVRLRPLESTIDQSQLVGIDEKLSKDDQAGRMKNEKKLELQPEEIDQATSTGLRTTSPPYFDTSTATICRLIAKDSNNSSSSSSSNNNNNVSASNSHNRAIRVDRCDSISGRLATSSSSSSSSTRQMNEILSVRTATNNHCGGGKLNNLKLKRNEPIACQLLFLALISSLVALICLYLRLMPTNTGANGGAFMLSLLSPASASDYLLKVANGNNTVRGSDWSISIYAPSTTTETSTRYSSSNAETALNSDRTVLNSLDRREQENGRNESANGQPNYAATWSAHFQQSSQVRQLIDQYELQTFIHLLLDTHLQTSRFMCTLSIGNYATLAKFSIMILYAFLMFSALILCLAIQRVGQLRLSQLDAQFSSLFTCPAKLSHRSERDFPSTAAGDHDQDDDDDDDDDDEQDEDEEDLHFVASRKKLTDNSLKRMANKERYLDYNYALYGSTSNQQTSRQTDSNRKRYRELLKQNMRHHQSMLEMTSNPRRAANLMSSRQRQCLAQGNFYCTNNQLQPWRANRRGLRSSASLSCLQVGSSIGVQAAAAANNNGLHNSHLCALSIDRQHAALALAGRGQRNQHQRRAHDQIRSTCQQVRRPLIGPAQSMANLASYGRVPSPLNGNGGCGAKGKIPAGKLASSGGQLAWLPLGSAATVASLSNIAEATSCRRQSAAGGNSSFGRSGSGGRSSNRWRSQSKRLANGQPRRDSNKSPILDERDEMVGAELGADVAFKDDERRSGFTDSRCQIDGKIEGEIIMNRGERIANKRRRDVVVLMEDVARASCKAREAEAEDEDEGEGEEEEDDDDDNSMIELDSCLKSAINNNNKHLPLYSSKHKMANKNRLVHNELKKDLRLARSAILFGQLLNHAPILILLALANLLPDGLSVGWSSNHDNAFVWLTLIEAFALPLLLCAYDSRLCLALKRSLKCNSNKSFACLEKQFRPTNNNNNNNNSNNSNGNDNNINSFQQHANLPLVQAANYKSGSSGKLILGHSITHPDFMFACQKFGGDEMTTGRENWPKMTTAQQHNNKLNSNFGLALKAGRDSGAIHASSMLANGDGNHLINGNELITGRQQTVNQLVLIDHRGASRGRSLKGSRKQKASTRSGRTGAAIVSMTKRLLRLGQSANSGRPIRLKSNNNRARNGSYLVASSNGSEDNNTATTSSSRVGVNCAGGKGINLGAKRAKRAHGANNGRISPTSSLSTLIRKFNHDNYTSVCKQFVEQRKQQQLEHIAGTAAGEPFGAAAGQQLESPFAVSSSPASRGANDADMLLIGGFDGRTIPNDGEQIKDKKDDSDLDGAKRRRKRSKNDGSGRKELVNLLDEDGIFCSKGGLYYNYLLEDENVVDFISNQQAIGRLQLTEVSRVNPIQLSGQRELLAASRHNRKQLNAEDRSTDENLLGLFNNNEPFGRISANQIGGERKINEVEETINLSGVDLGFRQLNELPKKDKLETKNEKKSKTKTKTKKEMEKEKSKKEVSSDSFEGRRKRINGAESKLDSGELSFESAKNDNNNYKKHKGKDGERIATSAANKNCNDATITSDISSVQELLEKMNGKRASDGSPQEGASNEAGKKLEQVKKNGRNNKSLLELFVSKRENNDNNNNNNNGSKMIGLEERRTKKKNKSDGQDKQLELSNESSCANQLKQLTRAIAAAATGADELAQSDRQHSKQHLAGKQNWTLYDSLNYANTMDTQMALDYASLRSVDDALSLVSVSSEFEYHNIEQNQFELHLNQAQLDSSVGQVKQQQPKEFTEVAKRSPSTLTISMSDERDLVGLSSENSDETASESDQKRVSSTSGNLNSGEPNKQGGIEMRTTKPSARLGADQNSQLTSYGEKTPNELSKNSSAIIGNDCATVINSTSQVLNSSSAGGDTKSQLSGQAEMKRLEDLRFPSFLPTSEAAPTATADHQIAPVASSASKSRISAHQQVNGKHRPAQAVLRGPAERSDLDMFMRMGNESQPISQNSSSLLNLTTSKFAALNGRQQQQVFANQERQSNLAALTRLPAKVSSSSNTITKKKGSNSSAQRPLIEFNSSRLANGISNQGDSANFNLLAERGNVRARIRKMEQQHHNQQQQQLRTSTSNLYIPTSQQQMGNSNSNSNNNDNNNNSSRSRSVANIGSMIPVTSGSKLPILTTSLQQPQNRSSLAYLASSNQNQSRITNSQLQQQQKKGSKAKTSSLAKLTKF